MTEDSADSSGPLVSVVVRAAGEGEGLARTLRSVLDQTWARLLILVVEPRGGGARGVIDALDPPRPGHRIVLTDLEPDAGRARATNAALQRAEGKYVAYLDAGDVFYRRHVERLAGALERSDRFGAAYGDHYRTYRRRDGDAPGRVLSKVLADHARFDRLRLCRRDYIPQTCLLHRRDLLDRTGPCEESLAHLADWDLVRRLGFYSDFLYLPLLTSERGVRVRDGGRISDETRRRAVECLRDQLLVRTRRPPKPWPCMPDVSIIFTPPVADDRALRTLRAIWRWTFAPYQVLLPLPAYELAAVKTEMPNLLPVPVGPGDGESRRIDRALAHCEGDYVAVVPPELPIADGWLETALHAISGRGDSREGIFLARADADCWAALLRKADLLRARRARGDLSVPASLAEAGLGVRKPTPDEVPFPYEPLVRQAEQLRGIGEGLRAAKLLEQIQRRYPDDPALRLRTASALYLAERHDEKALALCRAVNRRQPTVDSLVLEARLHRRADRVETAVELLEQSRRILNGKG